MEKKNVHIPYGLITALAMIVVGLAFQLTGNTDSPAARWLGMLPFIIGILAACIAFSKANNGFVTFGQVFGAGFKTTAIATLVLVAWTLISLSIFPDIQERALETAQSQMAANPNVSEEQIEQSLEFTRKNFKFLVTAGTLFMSLLTGVIVSLIGAAVAKKRGEAPPAYEGPQ